MILDPIRTLVDRQLAELGDELTDWTPTTTPAGSPAWGARPTWPGAPTSIVFFIDNGALMCVSRAAARNSSSRRARRST